MIYTVFSLLVFTSSVVIALKFISLQSVHFCLLLTLYLPICCVIHSVSVLSAVAQRPRIDLNKRFLPESPYSTK